MTVHEAPTPTASPRTPAPAAPRTADRRRPLLVVVAVLLVVGATVVAWDRLAVHPDGPLLHGEAVGWGSCVPRPAGEAATTVSGITVRPRADVTITGIRAVEPVNLRVDGGLVVPTTLDGGSGTILGEGAGFPPSPEQRRGAGVVWDDRRPLVGTELEADAEVVPLFHVEVLDPALEASYAGLEVTYRSGHRLHVATIDHAYRTAVGASGCLTD